MRAVPRGHQLDAQDGGADLLRRGHADGSRHHGLRPGADHRQLPVRARRRDGDAGRLDGGEVPRRARGRDRGSPPAGRRGRRGGRHPPRRRRRARGPRFPFTSFQSSSPPPLPHYLHAPSRAQDHPADHRRPRGAGHRGRDAGRCRQAGRHRDPLLLLRAQARQSGRRLPDVPGGDRGHPQAADLVLDAGQGRDGRPHPDRPRPPGPERRGGVPARQPPARLPGVRQGRRVPAPGHHVRLGARPQPVHRAQAPLREAAQPVTAGGDRPRALHPLLPLRALLAGGRRGLPAHLRGARVGDVRGHA